MIASTVAQLAPTSLSAECSTALLLFSLAFQSLPSSQGSGSSCWAASIFGLDFCKKPLNLLARKKRKEKLAKKRKVVMHPLLLLAMPSEKKANTENSQRKNKKEERERKEKRNNDADFSS